MFRCVAGGGRLDDVAAGAAGRISHECLFERLDDGTWVSVGGGSEASADPLPVPRAGGRLAAGELGQVGMAESVGDSCTRSTAYCLRHAGASIAFAPWVGCTKLQVASGVTHIGLGPRRIPVPPAGPVLIAWRLPATWFAPGRPAFTCLSADGAVLSVTSPIHDVDTFSLARAARR